MSNIETITRATIGRVVHVIGKGAESNGATVAPAMITRVWGEPTENGKQMVNLTIFPDYAKPQYQGSVWLYPSPRAAHDAVDGGTGTELFAAYWPERG
ncbi:hypothetical protein ACG04Q_12030 [Roseateles sp. DXS20W]|uniref:Uncharacterized protein n=1 Tax=Pelomonas lactea TaxID=3299030 RepID=A0ABW7GKH4_9BURK